jgi:hypothetical protein
MQSCLIYIIYLASDVKGGKQTLFENRVLRAFGLKRCVENRVLRAFGLKRDKVTRV